MADWGLLGGLAEGVRQGLGAYKDTQKFNMDRDREAQDIALKKKAYQAGLFEKGVEENPDEEGSFQFNAEKAPEMNYKKNQFLPDSPESISARTSARGILKTAKPEMTDEDLKSAIPDDTPAAQLHGENGLLSKMITGIYGGQNRAITANAVADRMGERNQVMRENMNLRREGFGMRQGTQAMQAGKEITGDKLIQSGVQSIAAADRGLSILNQPQMSKQDLAIATTDLAKIIQGGNPAQGSIHEAQYNSAYTKLKGTLDSIMGEPGDEVPAGVKQKLISQFNELKDVQKKINGERASGKIKSLRKSLPSNKQAQETLDELENQYAPEGLLKDQGMLPKPTPTPPHPEDNTALTWAKSNPKDPRAIAILKANGL